MRRALTRLRTRRQRLYSLCSPSEEGWIATAGRPAGTERRDSRAMDFQRERSSCCLSNGLRVVVGELSRRGSFTLVWRARVEVSYLEDSVGSEDSFFLSSVDQSLIAQHQQQQQRLKNESSVAQSAAHAASAADPLEPISTSALEISTRSLPANGGVMSGGMSAWLAAWIAIGTYWCGAIVAWYRAAEAVTVAYTKWLFKYTYIGGFFSIDTHT